MQNPIFTVFHEMFADCFYFGPERKDKPLQDPIRESLLKRDSTYAQQLEIVKHAASSSCVAFSKELSIYYQERWLPLETMRGITHCFLIRHPEKTARSFLRASSKGDSTYFDLDELGFAELDQLYELVSCAQGQPVIIDADDLCRAPEAMLHAWCVAIGVPYDSAMVSWSAMEPDTWKKWPGWHTDAANSTGFKLPIHKDSELPTPVRLAVDACLPIYQKLYERRVLPLGVGEGFKKPVI